MQISKILGFTIYALSTVDSTNNYTAIPEIQSKLPHKAVIMAEYQSQGKGQLTNKWESESGKNLLMSLFLKPDLIVKNQFLLSCVAALAIKDTISYFLKTEVVIKWPNDIYVNQKKIAGILIENSLSGSVVSKSIIGMGININQQYFKTGSYHSFKLFSGESHDRLRILEYLLYKFNIYYEQIKNPNNNLQHEFDQHLLAKDVWQNFNTKKNQVFRAKIVGTTIEGKLKLMLENNEIKSFDHKAIFFS